jgi:subtilase family serine protease
VSVLGFRGTRHSGFSLQPATGSFGCYLQPEPLLLRAEDICSSSLRMFWRSSSGKNIPGGKMHFTNDTLHAAVRTRRAQTISLYLVLATLIAGLTLPASAAGKFVAHNTPRYVSSAKNLGAVDSSKTIEVSIWLNPHNRAELDTLAEQLYDRNSPNYRHFLNRAQFVARFAPTAAEATAVKEFFAANGLTVVKVGPDNMFVRARGTVASVQTAFHVTLNNYLLAGKTLRANDRDPYVDDSVAPLVRTVSGLDSGEFVHPLASRSANLPTLKSNLAAAAVPKADGTPSLGYSNDCFNGTVTQTYSTNGNGSLPVGTYKGNHLNIFGLTTPGCAYTPPTIQAAYNLTGLYNEGFTGAGQTIGIIDWCGSPTIEHDANVFSAEFGLPLLTSSNFAITYIPTASSCEEADSTEINIDVEWSHAVAPGANINLIVPPSAYFQDIDQAEYIAIDSGLANVLSGSYGAEEIYVPASELETGNLLSELGAVLGISTNFSSGDSGDYTYGIEGIPPSISYPADSPYATGVGGITLALNSDNSIAWQAGWGNNETLLAETGYVFDPPLAFGFIGGSGGGPSSCAVQDSSGDCLAGFPKPSYQVGVPGKYRQLPDISWLADPYTGVAIAITVPGSIPTLQWQVWGGTSVACPMFSGLWAIANEEAGAPLGQAAPYVYSMPAGAIYDIVPVTSTTNVTATIQESTGTNHYNAATVAGVAPERFVSAIWDYADLQDTALVISFGTDSGLKTHTGWDNATGVGVPNAQAFADSFAPTEAVKK